MSDERLSPRPKDITDLARFCDRDFKGSIEGRVAQFFGGSPESAQQYVDSLQPSFSIPEEQITNFDGFNYDTLIPDIIQGPNNPHFMSWYTIRLGKAGSESLGAVQESLQEQAPSYASTMYDAYKKVKQEGFQGFIDFLDKAGYTQNRLEKLFQEIKTRKNTRYPHIDEAADIRKQNWEPGEPFFDRKKMQQSITEHYPQSIPVVVFPRYNNRRATTISLAQIAETEGKKRADVKVFMVTGGSIDDDVLIHEQQHAVTTAKMAKHGDIPNAIAGLGIQEEVARIAGGIDEGEAILFATYVEAAYKGAKIADSIFSQQKHDAETDESYQQRLVEQLQQEILKMGGERAVGSTGLKPVPGSEWIPYGVGSVPYFDGAVRGFNLQQQAKQAAISTPEALVDFAQQAR